MGLRGSQCQSCSDTQVTSHGEAWFDVGGPIVHSLRPYLVGDGEKHGDTPVSPPPHCPGSGVPNHSFQAVLLVPLRHEQASLSHSTVSHASQVVSWLSNPDVLKDSTPLALVSWQSHSATRTKGLWLLTVPCRHEWACLFCFTLSCTSQALS